MSYDSTHTERSCGPNCTRTPSLAPDTGDVATESAAVQEAGGLLGGSTIAGADTREISNEILLQEFFLRVEFAFSQSARLELQNGDLQRDVERLLTRAKRDLKEKQTSLIHLDSTRIALNQSIRERDDLKKRLQESRSDYHNLHNEITQERRMQVETERFREELWSQVGRTNVCTTGGEEASSRDVAIRELSSRLEDCERRLQNQRQQNEELRQQLVNSTDGSEDHHEILDEDIRKRRRVTESTQAIQEVMQAATRAEGPDIKTSFI